MKDEKQLDLVLERFYNRFNKFNSKVLEMLGETIKQFEGLTPTEAHELAQELKYSTNIDELLNELSRLSGKSVQELDELLDKVAEENVGFAEEYYKVKGKNYIPYEDNIQLKRYVDTIKNDTYGTFKNLSKARMVGFTWKENGKVIYRPLKTVYRDLIDKAVYNVSTGVVDYQSAMRDTIKQLSYSGVKVHENKVGYPSGYNRRIDSTIRQNILDSVRQVNIGIQQRVGEELGADGIEVSAHVPCAEDHLEINGKQFKAEKGETLDQLLDRVNSTLDRPIGELNCRHFVFSIVWGVNLPNYTDRELNSMRHESLSKVLYDGKYYTKYEATQVQRRIETSIRQQKDRQIMARASGDKVEISKAQAKISQLTSKYKDFSDKAGLDVYKNRLTVAGYKRVSTK